jgi:glycosyltransferase involved in cell wall biosynthesis
MLALKEMGHEVKVYNLSENLHSGEYEGVNFDTIKFKYKYSFYNSRKYLNSLIECLLPIFSKAEVVFHSEDRISTILAIQNAANSLNVKTVIELNEYPYGFKTRRLDFKFLRWIKQKIFFNYVLPKVNGTIVISKSLELLASKHNNNNIVRLPILSKNIEIGRRIDSNSTPYIFHAGALSENKDGIKSIIKSFNIAQMHLNGDLKLIFTQKMGLPSLINWINKYIKEHNLEDKIIFTGILNDSDLNSYYNNCSLAILNKPYNRQNKYNFPTKLTELTPRRIPLVISETGELKTYFKNGFNAITVKPNDNIAIANAIVKIIKDAKFTSVITDNALQTNKDFFYYKNYSSKLSHFYYVIKVTNFHV